MFEFFGNCCSANKVVNWLLQSQVITPKNACFEKSIPQEAFKLIIDSNDVGTGAVLLQEASDGLDHPVSYFSKKFLQYQKKYSVVEKETLGLVLALDYFDIYLCSTPLKIKVYTDRNPLNFLKQWKIRIKG